MPKWIRSQSGIFLFALLGAIFSADMSAQTFTEFPLPPGSQPVGIVTGPDGNLWFTVMASDESKICRITPAGVITQFGSYGALGDPAGIAAGPDGNLWFTELSGNRVSRITTAGVITQFSIASGANPFDIVAGPDGNLWFTEQSGNKIGRITTAGVVSGEFPLPAPASGPTDITAGPDGNLWFTEASASKIGRITTTGVITEFSIPSGVHAAGLARGLDGDLWFAAHGRIGRITIGGVITEFSIPSGANAGGIAAGPDGSLWFTEENAIGRMTPAPSGPSVACAADSTTLCLNGGRFRVQAEWQLLSGGTSGQGRAVPLTANTGTFWFFDPTNIEVVVKVLNACSLNSRYWLFAGGLTNVGVTLTITDTQTGVTEIYSNPVGTAFEPIQDTAAFSTCP